MVKRSRRTRIVLWATASAAALVVAVAGMVLTTNLVISRAAAGHIARIPQEAPHAQVAIVLGARVYESGVPSPMLKDRLDTAVALYRLGKVEKLLLSGDHGHKSYDEVNAMLAYVVAQGLPDEDVFTDHAGFSTYDTMYRARDVFKVTTALVVTQRFHLSRAVYTGRELGLDATGVVADLQAYSSERRFAIRDWLAQVKAFFQLHVTHPKPRFLGPAHPI